MARSGLTEAVRAARTATDGLSLVLAVIPSRSDCRCGPFLNYSTEKQFDVLCVRDGKIAEITTFGAGLLGRFGLPETL